MQPVLYWAPERRGSLWARAWDLVWASPLTDALLALFGASRRGRLAELADAACAPYLAGGSLACTSVEDGAWMVREIFGEETYARVADDLEGAAFILDVGANVGAFAAWCVGTRARARAARGDGAGGERAADPLTVVCVEPVRSTADACELNAARVKALHADCDIRVARLGLAAPAQRGAALELTHFEDVPSCSTTRPQDKHAANIAPLLARAENFLKYYGAFRPRLCAAIRLVPSALGARRAACELAVAYLWRWSRAPVALGSVRDAFAATRTAAPDRIDVLKVDVEGLELAVLESIEDEWWPRVRRVIVEVHDLGARCDKVLALLRAKGFAAQKLSDDYYNDEIGMNHHMIVAHRGEPQQTAG